MEIAKQLVVPAKEERLAWWRVNFEFRISQAVKRLRSGKITLGEFQEFGRKHLKDYLYGIAQTGAEHRLSRKELYKVRRTLKEQVKYWDGFAQSIEVQRRALKGLKGAELDEAMDKLYAKVGRRARSYSGAVEAEGEKWDMAARFPEGGVFRWDMNPELANCVTCIGRDKKTYPMKDGRLPFYPKDGSTICLYNCGCIWTRVLRPPSGKRKKLGPPGARRRGKKLRGKSEDAGLQNIQP